MPAISPQLKFVSSERQIDRLDARFRQSKYRSLAETARHTLDDGLDLAPALTPDMLAFLDRYAAANGLDRAGALAATLAAGRRALDPASLPDDTPPA